MHSDFNPPSLASNREFAPDHRRSGVPTPPDAAEYYPSPLVAPHPLPIASVLPANRPSAPRRRRSPHIPHPSQPSGRAEQDCPRATPHMLLPAYLVSQ